MSRAQTGEMAHEYLCGGISFLLPLAPPPLQRSAAFALHGRLLRARRMVEPANPTEYEYAEGNIPMEWDAWIRGRRKEPPSAKELLKNETYRENIKLKAREVEEKDLTLQAQEYEEGLVATSAKTVAKGHASITSFGKQEVSEDPTSTANAFQPGSWMPKK
ncbi:NADH dehydrogenase [ubiquinone] 1 alpha subcomplex assembly factor 2 isoform X5 [Cyclopterus lumpus]|uniref:NADH dehydrogenase [ubiquinone] 1 alpha subcomplex assembly factor 2 isoform X5 n=1 Tax=Cyclopterus lumpus TaxID=8103 RepID=UPI001486CCF8|nr:NADH dehydrogenase [ubiquinone] 1 alpha subcomplex assembly factor 2 isoform X5 [Cyclopterus lumpus]